MTRHLRPVSGLAVAALFLAGCSGSDEGGGETSAGAGSSGGDRSAAASSAAAGSSSAKAGSSSAKSSKKPAPKSSKKSAASPTGPPAYTRQAGSFSSSVAKKLGRRTVPDGQMHGPGGSTGTWKGTKIGVLTKGQDATLVVRSKDTWKIVGGWWPSKNLPGPYLGGKRHVVMLGSDARTHQPVARSRADAIQVVGLDGKGGAGILGIPRDTRATMPGGGTGKVNAAMPKGGPAAQKATVARMTGLPIQGYLVTGMNGFGATVDAMGGVKVTLKRQIRHLKPGTHTLKGADLLWVARERKTLPRGDIDRSSNQGMVLVAVLSTLRERGISKLPDLMTKTGRHFQTNLSTAQVLTLLANGYALSPTRVGRTVADTRPAGPDLALTSKAQKTFKRFADGNL